MEQQVEDTAARFQVVTRMSPERHRDRIAVVGVPGERARCQPDRIYRWTKRSMDAVVAAILLVLLLPVFVVIALLIRLTSPGSVLFSQERIGEGGRSFVLYKFRSMVANADPRVHQAAIERFFRGEALAPESSTTKYKLVNDPRITKIGGILRKTSLDELPQLYNVLRGEMSLVGPRPALAYEVARYSDFERQRLAVPQGLTGLWQVKGRSQVSYFDALHLDVEYVAHCSLALDCKILLLTVPTLLFGRGGA